MATIKIHCPNCHQEYDVDEADLGLEAECQSCKQSFVVQRDAPSQETQPSKSKKTVTVEKKTTLRQMKCDMCGGTDLVKQEGLFVCQHCGAKYSVEEARKMMMEGDGDLVVSGTIKINNDDHLENLYTLARREMRLKNYVESLKYYDMILLEDPKNWEPVFAISFIKTGQFEHRWEDIAEELENFNKIVDEAVVLLVNSDKDEAEKNRLLGGAIVESIVSIARAHIEAILAIVNMAKSKGEWDLNNKKIYADNLDAVALLFEKAADICDKYLPTAYKSKKMNLLKTACENAMSSVIRNRLTVRIMNEEPGYIPPPLKIVKDDRTALYAIIFISVLFVFWAIYYACTNHV